MPEPKIPSRPIRPLLPAPPAAGPGSASGAGQLEAPPSTNPPAKVHLPAACETCRRRKSKCTGERPTCGYCRQRGLECDYHTDESETHSQARKRKYDQVQTRASQYEELFGFLRTLPERDAQDVLRKLRSGADITTLLRHITSGDILIQLALTPETRLRYDFPYKTEMPASLLSDNVYLHTLIYDPPLAASSPFIPAPQRQEFRSPGHQCIYLTPMHAAEVVDAQLSAARPSLWTTVCSDDKLMVDVLTVFFRSEYSFQIAFHKDYFLEDMAAGKEEFCSSLLVNTVLAYSCSCYPYFVDRSEYWNPRTLSYKFFVEAKRIWELEAEQPRNTTIQAGILLNLLHNMCGLDKIGRAYSVQAVALAYRLQLFSDVSETRSQGSRSEDGNAFTAWMLYNFETLVAYHFLHPPLIAQVPSVAPPNPLTNPRWYGEVQLRYPRSQVVVETYHGHLLKARCHFRVIMNGVCHAAFKDGAEMTLDLADAFYVRLVAWHDGLPECLSPKYIVHPGHFQLHIHYHSLVISLFEPLLSKETGDTSILTKRISDARKYLETLIRVYYLRHGFDATDVFICAPLTLVGFMCIKAINEARPGFDLDAVRSTLFLVAKGLQSQGRSYYLAETLFQVVRGAMRSEEAAILRRIGHAEEGKTRETQSQMQAIHSTWPVSIASRSEDLEANRLTQLVERFATSNLEELDGSEAGTNESGR